MASCFVPPFHEMDSTLQPSLVSVIFKVTLNFGPFLRNLREAGFTVTS